jgi:RNA polymerase sigma-70 factor (ECF subfamily)
MRRLATNAASDQLRAIRHRAETAALPEVQVQRPATEALSDSIALAFQRLPPKFQIVARLALIEERPYTEIAEALRVPVGTVKSRVFRAVRALRRELSRLGIQP